VFSGESRLVFTLADCPRRCGYKSKMSNSHCIIKSHENFIAFLDLLLEEKEYRVKFALSRGYYSYITAMHAI